MLCLRPAGEQILSKWVNHLWITWRERHLLHARKNAGGLKTKAQVIAFANIGGGDAVQGAMKLIRAFPKEQRIVVAELPCVGLPRIAYTFDQQIAELSKERTIDQFLLDLDRKALKPMPAYMVQRSGVDYLLVNPRSQPEAPVIRKLSSNQTLISAPTVLRQQLEGSSGALFRGKTDPGCRSVD